MTVALPLSAGRMTMFPSSHRFFTAFCSSLQRLLLGVLAVLRMELTLCLSSCAVSLSSWLAVVSVAVVISKVGIHFGVTAKFRPSASASFSFGARLLLLRFFTILSWSSCGGARCCLTCRHSYFCGLAINPSWLPVLNQPSPA